MKVVEIFEREFEQGAPVCFSYEFFPPKTEEALHQLYDTMVKMKQCRPTFCDVSWGALGQTFDTSLEIARCTQQAVRPWCWVSRVPCRSMSACVGVMHMCANSLASVHASTCLRVCMFACFGGVCVRVCVCVFLGTCICIISQRLAVCVARVCFGAFVGVGMYVCARERKRVLGTCIHHVFHRFTLCCGSLPASMFVSVQTKNAKQVGVVWSRVVCLVCAGYTHAGVPTVHVSLLGPGDVLRSGWRHNCT